MFSLLIDFYCLQFLVKRNSFQGDAMSLSGKVAVITGGGQGIGKAIAKALKVPQPVSMKVATSYAAA